MKKIVVTSLAFLLTFSLFLSSVQAANEDIVYDYVIEPDTPPSFEVEDPYFDDRVPVVSPGSGTGYELDSIIRTAKYSKENVKKYDQWSGYKRVSQDLNTFGFGATGAITADREASFHTTASGNYANLGFSFGKSETSAVGYTLNVPANKRVYLGFRVLYSVETGTRVTKVGGVVKNRQPYTYKRPQYGEYRLLAAPVK